MIDEQMHSTSRSVGLFTLIALFVFFTMLLATGGLFFYKGYLSRSIAKMESDLTLAKNRFEPSRIENLQKLDKRLRVADEVLGNHVALSPVFKALEEITMKTVRYTKFDYSLSSDGSPKATIKLAGVAVGYRAVALQSDLFAKNKNLIDPVFSNLNLDENGNVLFDLEFSVDANFINYREMLKREAVAQSPQ